MRLVLIVSMQSVHTVHTGIALFEELGSNLREHSVGQNVLFLDGILGSFGLQLVHFGGKGISKAVMGSSPFRIKSLNSFLMGAGVLP